MSKIITDNELISEEDAAAMQQVVAAEQKVRKEGNPSEQERKPQVNTLTKVKVEILISLGLYEPVFFLGLRKQLSACQVGETLVNLYSPFRKAKVKKPGDVATEGILRACLPEFLATVNEVNNSEVAFIGKFIDVNSHVKSLADTLKTRFVDIIGIDPETPILQIEDGEEDTTQVLFKDIIDVSAWVNSNTSDPVVNHQTIVVNLKVNAGILYDSGERHLYMQQLESLLANIVEPVKTKTIIRLLVNLDPVLLQRPEVRETFDFMLDELSYRPLTREIVSRISSEFVGYWMPTTKAAVERDLLMSNSTMLLLEKIVNRLENS